MDEKVLENLLSALNSFGLKSSQTHHLFLENCAVKSHPKNQIIIQEQEKNGMEYILIEGVLHRFNLNKKGENATTGFYVGHSVVTPHFARTINGKSIFSLQALTDALVAEIPVAELDKLRYAHMEFRQFGQKVIEQEFTKNLLADITLRSSSAKEHLSLLRKTYPNLENLVPHHVIASYLGITNVSFSRLRKNEWE